MSNSLTVMRPELVREWSDKNLPLTPDKITYLLFQRAEYMMNRNIFLIRLSKLSTETQKALH